MTTPRCVNPALVLLAFAAQLPSCLPRDAEAQPRHSAAPHASTPPSAGTALRVDAPARTALVAVGDAVPAFHATASDGRAIDVAAGARPRALVVYFYPRDETSGCTAEAEAFRDEHAVITAAGADIVGVSTDDNAAHVGFAANHHLPFALVADPQGRLAAAFGVPVSGGYAQRTTFVVDRHGRVARVFSPVHVQGHAAEVIAALRAL